MRIAVLLYGRVRHFEKQYNHIMENIVQGNEADFFLSHSPTQDTEEELQQFIEMYKPKKVVNEMMIHADYSKYPILPGHPHPPYNMFCMQLNRLRVRNACIEYMNETGVSYDIYVCHRVDMCLFSKYPLEDIQQRMNDEVIFIPYNQNYYWIGMNDAIAVGNFGAMMKYLSLYDYIYQILDQGVLVHPETVMLYYLYMIGLPVIRLDLDHNIVR
jgi:hypothetical protein